MTTDLIVSENHETALIGLVADPQMLVDQAAQAAQALKRVVDQQGLSRRIGNSEHIAFEGWQTVGHFYGITASVEWVREVDEGYEARAVALRHGQQVGAAEAVCLRSESSWANKPEFQLRSMAQTRAMAKALRSVLAFVVVLAGYAATPSEEMEHIEVAGKTECEHGPRLVRSGTKNGKQWSGEFCPGGFEDCKPVWTHLKKKSQEELKAEAQTIIAQKDQWQEQVEQDGSENETEFQQASMEITEGANA